MTAEQVAKRIKISLDQWPGNCATIAAACIKARVVRGRYCYGMYYGPISPRSSRFAGRPFTHHAWVVPDDRPHLVWDPTRWAFEAVAPYIHVGPAAPDYDQGGNRLLGELHRSPPAPGKARWHLRLPPAALHDLGHILGVQDRYAPAGCAGGWDGGITPEQALFLANTPLQLLGDHALALYQELLRVGQGGPDPGGQPPVGPRRLWKGQGVGGRSVSS